MTEVYNKIPTDHSYTKIKSDLKKKIIKKTLHKVISLSAPPNNDEIFQNPLFFSVLEKF